MADMGCIEGIRKILSGSATDKDIDEVIETLQKGKNDPAFQTKMQDLANQWAHDAGVQLQRRKLSLGVKNAINGRIEDGQVAMAREKAEAPPAPTTKVGKFAKGVKDFASFRTDMNKILSSYLVGTDKGNFKGAVESTAGAMQDASKTGPYNVWAAIAKQYGVSPERILHDKPLGDLVAREMFGEDTGNSDAKFLSGVYKTEYKRVLDRLNAAGADIKELPEYIFAQFHNQARMAANKEGWIAFIKPLLNYAKTFGPDDDVDDFLSTVHDNIIQGKHDEYYEPEDSLSHVSGLAKRISRHRVLHFKDAQSFLDYNDEYGHGVVQSNIINQMARMDSQAALLEKMGPNPDATFNWMVDHGASLSRKDGKDFMLKKPQIESLKRQFQVIAHQPETTNFGLANFFSGWRNLTRAATLGFSTVSSFSDEANLVAMFHQAGMPYWQAQEQAAKSFMSFFPDYAKSLAKGGAQGILNPEEILALKSFHSGLDGILHCHKGRFDPFGDAMSHGWTAQLQSWMFRANGQAIWDDRLQYGAMQGLSTYYAEQADKHFLDLPQTMQQNLLRSGIDKEEWDVMRQHVSQVAGHNMIVPQDIPDSKVMAKYNQHLLHSANNAVPLPTPKEVAMMNAWIPNSGQRGTIGGEVMKMAMMYRAFPLSNISRNWPMVLRGGPFSVASYMTHMTALGYLSLVVKAALNGKQPPSIEDGKTFAAAMAQGGALSFAGDILLNDAGRSSQGGALTDMFLGPALSNFNDLYTAAAGEAEDGGHGVQLTKMIGRNVPFANLWMVKGLYQYLLINHILETENPGYLERSEQRAATKYDEHYLISPSATEQSLHPNE